MKVGVWFYGLGTALTGILDIAWGDFDASHQPIQALGKDLPGQHLLAYVAGVWLIAAGLAILWRRSARVGAAASAIAYLIFMALWLTRYSAGIHAYGWRIAVLLGISFGLAQQLMLVAPAAIVYASAASPDSLLEKRAEAKQEITPPYSGLEIGWAVPYVQRFPNADLSAMIAQAGNLRFWQWGGAPPD